MPSLEDVEVSFTNVITVEEIYGNFSDAMVCMAARTSTQGGGASDEERYGLINALMQGRHGSPFEHMMVTFRVHAPIFVWREHHRHRIGFSYNEESGRYKKLEPVFYLPGPERDLVQVGKAMSYESQPGTPEQYERMIARKKRSVSLAYWTYLEDLQDGVMREVARIHLPLNIYSTCVVTMNARSLMSFLSLRQRHDDAKFPSKPQYEINVLADGYEQYLSQTAAMVYRSYTENGRVAP